MMKLKNKHFALIFGGLIAGLLTLVFLTIYAVGQQVLRQDANDPQIQIAEDSAAYLSASGTPADFDNSDKKDIAQSLAPFLAVYDSAGQPVAASALVDNQLPQVPLGVLQAAQKSGEDRVTWQPSAGLRFALVVSPFTGQTPGYVAVARSLREVEIRENNLLKIDAVAWLASLLILGLILTLKEIKRRQKN